MLRVYHVKFLDSYYEGTDGLKLTEDQAREVATICCRIYDSDKSQVGQTEWGEE